MKKILILTSGPATKLSEFELQRDNVGFNFDTGSFNDISFDTSNSSLKFKDKSLLDYSLIYFRLVGKSLETASVVANFAKENGIKVIDPVYENSLVLATSVSKFMEHYKLAGKVNLPKTYFSSLKSIRTNAPTIFHYPYIIKSTTGRKSRDVWLVNQENEQEIFMQLLPREKSGDRFFAQEYIRSLTRTRILVVGDAVLAGVVQPTKYIRKINPGITKEEKDALKKPLLDVPEELAEISIKCAKAVDLYICGVDLLKNEDTNEYLIIEANAAPAWRLISKYCNLNVELAVLKFIETLI